MSSSHNNFDVTKTSSAKAAPNAQKPTSDNQGKETQLKTEESQIKTPLETVKSVKTDSANQSSNSTQANVTQTNVTEVKEAQSKVQEEVESHSIPKISKDTEKSSVLLEENAGVAQVSQKLIDGATQFAKMALNTVLGTTVTQSLDVINTNKVLGTHRQTLFKGLFYSYRSNAARNSFLFSTMPLCQGFYEQHFSKENSVYLSFGTANTAEAIFWTPFSLLRQRIMTTSAKTVKEAYKFYPHSFLKAVIKGASWGGLRNLTFGLPFIYTYKKAEKFFIEPNDGSFSDYFKRFLMGGGIGIGASVGSYPFNVIQMKVMNSPQETARGIWKQGYKALYKGFWIASTRMFAYSGALVTSMCLADKGVAYLKENGFFSNQGSFGNDSRRVEHLFKRRP